jgi:uncharacterized protein (DUF362 family)
LAALGLDAGRYGQGAWNPLGALIRSGETVLLKPNLIKEVHPRDPQGWRYVMTHASVLRAIADFIWLAIGSTGRIVVADAPQTDSSFSQIVQTLQLNSLRDFYRGYGLNLDIVDLRREEWQVRDQVITKRIPLSGDPLGYIAYDLGQSSEFAGHLGEGRYYGADYDSNGLNERHSGGRHEYLIAGSTIKCDVILSVPKLKTHKKTGLTASLKNLVGVNGDKNWLPHHTSGHPGNGGDEFPSDTLASKLEGMVASFARRTLVRTPALSWLHRAIRPLGVEVFGDSERTVRSGNWAGNDTAWRMCLDLNKIVLYGKADGTLRAPAQDAKKRHYVLVDGVIAGEGAGPLNPDPLRAGVVMFGVNPASVDAACAYLMGFDPDKIPLVRQAFQCRAYPIADWDWRDVRIVSNVQEWNNYLPEIPDEATFHFEPHFGWKGAIERHTAIEALRAHD